MSTPRYGESTPNSALPVRQRAGRLLDYVGQVGLPLGIGVGVGYFASDRGIPLYPHIVEAMFGLGILSLLFMASGRFLRGKAYAVTERGTQLRKRIVAAMVLALALLAGRLAFEEAQEPTPLTAMSPAEFDHAFEADTQRYRALDDTLHGLLTEIEGADWATSADTEVVLSADEEAVLRDQWGSVWAHLLALDQLRVAYEDWWRFDPSRFARDRHLRAFLLSGAAELSLIEASLRMSLVAAERRNVRTFLDSPHEGRGLPPASFSRMRRELQGNRDLVRVVAVERYMDLLRHGFQGRTEAGSLGAGWLWDRTQAHLSSIETMNPLDRVSLQAGSTVQPLRKGLRRALYPAQKGFAESMGDTRTRRAGEYLITEAQIAEMRPALHPGDIAMSRKNWYLSNLGLPGFWPHAILVLGPPETFVAYFDDPEVTDWVTEQAGRPMRFDAWLARSHPDAWRRYSAGEQDGEHHVNYEVLEAISEGVVFNTWPHAAGDYLAVVRPQLSKVAKAQAIASAFGELDKPYDFNFDFASDHTLVCTELVWRAYRPAEDKEGLDIPLVTVAGRPTLPANELARLYAAQWETQNGGEHQLDFVWFWDTSEADQRAYLSDEAAFRASHARPQWDTAQQ